MMWENGKGVCLLGTASPVRTTPLSTSELRGIDLIAFCFWGPHPLWGGSLHLDLWWPQNFLAATRTKDHLFRNLLGTTPWLIFQASSQLFMLWQYPSYSHSSILRLWLKVTLSQPMEKEQPIAPGPWLQDASFPRGQGLIGICSESCSQPQASWTRSLGTTQIGNWSPNHRKSALEWTPRHTQLYTWTHIHTNSSAKLRQPAASGLYKDPLLSLHHGWQIMSGLIFLFNILLLFCGLCFLLCIF